MRENRRFRSTICLFCLSILCALGFCSNSVFATATESTISLSISSGCLSVSLLGAPGGTFANSGNAVVSVTTDNFTGYVLSVNTGSGTSLVSENDDEIESISSAISGQTFLLHQALGGEQAKNTQIGKADGKIQEIDKLLRR